MNAMVAVNTSLKQRLGDLEQRLDIGHAHQPETDAFATLGTGLTVPCVGRQHGRTHVVRKLTSNGFVVLACYVQGQQLTAAACRLLVEGLYPRLDELAVLLNKVRGVLTGSHLGRELIHPQTSDLGHRILRTRD